MKAGNPVEVTEQGGTHVAHIVVCICTYKRPAMLRRLLRELKGQKTGGLFSFEVVVIDNDSLEAAKEAVDEFAASSSIKATYFVEPEQNIALARNRAVRAARGDYIAFIDDDEFPDESWLLHLMETARECSASVVLGPVVAWSEAPIPQWLQDSKLLERRRFPTSTRITRPSVGGTGNVLFAASLFRGDPEPFNPRFGRTGGEDSELFGRLLREGKRIIWCDEALAYEFVPPERLTRAYHLRRALLRGVSEARRGGVSAVNFAKSTLAVLVYTVLVLLALLCFRNVWMKYLVKKCDHLGKITAVLGIELVRERTFL